VSLDQISDPPQRKALEELLRLKTQNVMGSWSGILDRITTARQKYAATLKLIQSSGSDSIYDATLLELPDPVWQKMQQEVKQAGDRILTQGIAPGLPSTQLDAIATVQLNTIAPETRTIATRILIAALKQPNLIRDDEQTRIQAEKAAQMVRPEMITVRQGEVIVQSGQRITPENFILLDHFKLSRRETNWLGLIGLAGLVSGAIFTFWRIEQRFHAKGLRNRDYWLVGLMTLSTPLLILIKAPSTNLPAIGFLMGTFYGSVLAGTSVGLLTILLPIGMGIGATQWIPSAAAGLVVALLASRVRSREELALLGLGAGLTQGTLYLVIGALAGVVWYGLLGRAVLEALIGLAWSIVAIGISPYIEHVFDVVTTLRLVELANPNRPLLKRLSTETPGTFQHTLFVANLAEAAARALGCNVELVRAGTLYHDIGKMHDPLGFIENQMGGVNKHDLINDPWTSAKIIKKHVTEGLVMARKARLPKVVQAFIPEHQGTMTIAYFYHQAKQRAQADPSIVIDESDFRYDGPAPQSRETGIVMLADSCEAALRSLKDATPEEALNMINKILAARWKDGQLDESGLTREEMGRIADVFVQVWQQSNHQRIAYPKVGGK
jgi:putative nucleotidyltransferase with HDIG domain